MTARTKKIPDYIFESSWEVCNKVGGIYTVLSTRAQTLQKMMKDKVFFVGPDFWRDKENPLFIEDSTLFPKWLEASHGEGLSVRTGRWNIPGTPIVFLVDFNPFFIRKNEIYTNAWNDYKVDSLHAYGDYDEASMFSYAAAKVVESFYKNELTKKMKVVYQAHEWMTALGALYLQKYVPTIATIFTTHATSIGRSIAGNGKPLYDYMFAYNGDQMAEELNMQSKHSVEKQAAHNVDCFTTVSDITAAECKQLLEKEPDVVLKNGFENDFVPKLPEYNSVRKKARQKLLDVASVLTGCKMTNDDTIIIGTGGRYEYKNKGLDIFLEAIKRLRDSDLSKNVLAVINVPAWVGNPRQDLIERLDGTDSTLRRLANPVITHYLNNFEDDKILNALRYHGLNNNPEDKVKVMFVPCYLDGKDGILNMSYYNLMPAYDLNVYPSYYEPWGYTPLESIAFKVPCITTDLAGFGLWANTLKPNGLYSQIEDGVKVVHRTDSNYDEAAEEIKNTILGFTALKVAERNAIRRKARLIADNALWKNFIEDYVKAYDVALSNAAKRIKSKK